MEAYAEIKRLALVAMFSVDELMDVLVLKGGNLLDLVYKVSSRASLDLDFSMAGSFAVEDLPAIKEKVERSLITTFNESDFHVFDVSFTERPLNLPPEGGEFWGGYRVEFKAIELDKYRRIGQADLEGLRRNARVVGPAQQRKFKIDISKFEYCGPKQTSEFDGYTIYVYTPEMMALEKLRAICQQMPEYPVRIRKSARARDFFDIHTLLTNFAIKLSAPENVEVLKSVFLAKKVPLRLIGKVCEFREYHRQDYASLASTVRPGTDLRPFDYYFDYVVENCCKPLESLRIEEPPPL
jgi:predicted nucleotidyltransferase component of viral defense system